MGRKFIIEEVEEESKFGCGSIVATIIIALVIGLCGGFKSCKEDKKPKAVESRTEQPQRLDEVKVQSPPYVPKSSHPSVSTPTPTTASKPQKEASAESITEIIFDDDIETEKPGISTTPTPTQQDNSIVTETYSETPALTEKERRKAERQAKREARRREKAQKNN